MLMELHPEAIRLNPNDDSAFINRGMAYARKGANYRAIADYNEVIQLDPLSLFAVGEGLSCKSTNRAAISRRLSG
jgi:tetratricopeptide (TPR) repeat protein